MVNSAVALFRTTLPLGIVFVTRHEHADVPHAVGGYALPMPRRAP
jgi:hypothetical protein